MPYTSPIIFSDAMVAALMGGYKSQTRRIITGQWRNVSEAFSKGTPTYLWVREGWTDAPITAWNTPKQPNPKNPDVAAYFRTGFDRSTPRWKPSIHMPRWANRLCLRVTDVRQEPLQAISPMDARQEGVCLKLLERLPHLADPLRDGGAVAGFSALWDGLHGEKEGEAWADNPDVLAFSFDVLDSNIDEVAA